MTGVDRRSSPSFDNDGENDGEGGAMMRSLTVKPQRSPNELGDTATITGS